MGDAVTRPCNTMPPPASGSATGAAGDRDAGIGSGSGFGSGAEAGPGAPRYALVLLDLDGTLIDSAPDLTLALGGALTAFGLPAQDLAAVRRMVGEGQRVLVQRALRRAHEALGKPPLLGDALEARVDEVLPRFRKNYEANLVTHTTVYPEVRETLAALPAAIQQAVATNKPGVWARRIVEILGLGDTLRWVLGEDDVGRRKPDPALVHVLCDRAGVAPERTLLVGDSRIDRETARAAGIDFAFCPYGYTDADTAADIRAAQARTGLRPGSYERPFLLERFSALRALLAPAGAAVD